MRPTISRSQRMVDPLDPDEIEWIAALSSYEYQPCYDFPLLRVLVLSFLREEQLVVSRHSIYYRLLTDTTLFCTVLPMTRANVQMIMGIYSLIQAKDQLDYPLLAHRYIHDALEERDDKVEQVEYYQIHMNSYVCYTLTDMFHALL